MFSSCDQRVFNEASAPLNTIQMIQCQPECVGGLFELTISDPITPLPTVSKQSLQASGFWKLHLLAGPSRSHR